MPQSQTEDQLTHREEETHGTDSHNIIKNKATSSLFLSRINAILKYTMKQASKLKNQHNPHAMGAIINNE